MDPRRLRRVAIALLFACGAAPAEEGIRVVLQSSPLAGFRYYAAATAWPEMQIGDELVLAREPGNAHDANAVAVLWRGHKLGYVPRSENAALAWGLDRGVPLRARISALVEHPNPARRVRFEVYVE